MVAVTGSNVVVEVVSVDVVVHVIVVVVCVIDVHVHVTVEIVVEVVVTVVEVCVSVRVVVIVTVVVDAASWTTLAVQPRPLTLQHQICSLSDHSCAESDDALLHLKGSGAWGGHPRPSCWQHHAFFSKVQLFDQLSYATEQSCMSVWSVGHLSSSEPSRQLGKPLQ